MGANVSFWLASGELQDLKRAASMSTISVSEFLRRAVHAYIPICHAALSGAAVEGVYANTSSGTVLISRGF